MNTALSNIKHIILVASGKGGVGKSMVAANLAVALSRDGYATGLLDADLYGPSVPLTLGMEGKNLHVASNNGKETFEPLVNYGVKIMSLGFLMKKEEAIIWRGPMASNALGQLLENTTWGELDFLVIDMPPGTGDISITLAQKLPEAKALIVVTPQEMAVADGRKAASMFRSNNVNIPILGVIENMAWFTPDKHPDEKYYLFGKEGGQRLASELHVPLLAQIPLVSDACELGDRGKTIFASNNTLLVKAFEKLSATINQPAIAE